MVAPRFTSPDGGTPPRHVTLSSDEVFRILGSKVKVGILLSGISFAGGIVGVIAAQSAIQSLPWIIASVLFVAASGFVHYRARQKLQIARRISEQPTLVFWVHKTVLRTRTGKDVPFITLHMRDGTTYEVAMTESQMLAIADWARAANPDLRIGEYDRQGA